VPSWESYIHTAASFAPLTNFGDMKTSGTHNIRHEATTEKTILNRFRQSTFSHSLGQKPPPRFVTGAAGAPQ
jgi:hypothetical protein